MKRLLVTVIAVVLGLTFCIPVSADSYNYNNTAQSYSYNSWGEPVAAPAAYEVTSVYYAHDMGLEDNLKNPGDMFVSSSGDVYVLDTENNRIVVLDTQFKVKNIISEFKLDGKAEVLNNPRGIFVSEKGDIYVADTDNNRVIRSDGDGNIKNIYTKPTSELFPQGVEYKPIKVLSDSADNVYVLVDGVYQGVVLYSPEGVFDGFYGSNRVEVTARVLLDYFWKRIMTQEQIGRMARYVPVNYVNMYIDQRDFVYAVATGGLSRVGRLKKLNPSGINILRTERASDAVYGDKEVLYFSGRRYDAQLISVCVDSDNFIYTLDSTRNRVFMYDQDSNLITVFGGEGNQRGSFRGATAVETFKDNVLVLDSTKGNITVFSPTTYGANIREAFKLYNAGLFEEAVIPWEKVVKLNGNLDLAYSGIGKAMLKAGDSEGALEAFKTGYNRNWYSKAYQDFRKETVRDNFLIVFIIMLLVIASVVLVLKRKKVAALVGIPIGQSTGEPGPWKYPLKVLIHPFEAFEDLKYTRVYSFKASTIILTFWVLAKVFERQLTGFPFNLNKMDEFNVFYILGSTLLIFFIWSVVNWAICTLFDGEGTLKEIWVASAYALTPYVLSLLITTFLSNFIIMEEGLFLIWMVWIGMFWSGCLMIAAVKSVHQYEMSKTIMSILSTVLGIAVVLFLMVLFVSLIQQLAVFLTTVINEIFLMFR